MLRRFFPLSLILSGLLFSMSQTPTVAQENQIRKDKIYFRSGFGLSLPVAESRDFLDAKFSTSLGGLVFLGPKNFFFYPKIGLNAYGYDQLNLDAGANNRVMHGRSTTYLLSMDLGYRRTIKHFGFYGFGGGGGGIILLPKISDPEADVIRMYNTSNLVMLLEAGVGTDYSFGNVLVFAEASYTHGLNKLEQQRYRAIPLSFGVRTNITRIFYK
ncbi:hypothetical protein ACTHQF_08340 [Pedobacter sp. SAFR-022]